MIFICFGRSYLWFTYDLLILLMIYLWFTYDLLMITYDLLMITYDHLLYLWFTNVVGRFCSAQPFSRAIHSELLAAGPLEGSTIDVPPSIAVSTGFLRRGPEYSSSTETNAHECLFSPTSVLDSTWNKRSILQNQTLSIRSSKAPWDIPGGRMKTKSWRLDFLGFFPANGQQEMRCSFGCFVCPIARVLKIAIWPVPSVEHNFLKVSSRALFCK